MIFQSMDQMYLRDITILKDTKYIRALMVGQHGDQHPIEFMMQTDYLLVGVPISNLIYLLKKIHCIVFIQIITTVIDLNVGIIA